MKKLLIILIFIEMISGCDVLDPASPVPAFIKIDSVGLQSSYSTQGSNSARITDAWVFVDNEYLGTFPLPAEFPVITTGETHKISIRAGIMENGISALRAAYPKYAAADTLISLAPEVTYTLNPQFRYNTIISFPELEDFDDNNLSLVQGPSGTAALTITQSQDPNAFEGNSGNILLDNVNTTFEFVSADTFLLPISVPSYMELNYKCESDFSIGLYISTTTGVQQKSLISVRASSEWKKIYINIPQLGGILSDATGYKISVYGSKPSTVQTSNLYFDNLKVVF